LHGRPDVGWQIQTHSGICQLECADTAVGIIYRYDYAPCVRHQHLLGLVVRVPAAEDTTKRIVRLETTPYHKWLCSLLPYRNTAFARLTQLRKVQ